MGSLIGLRHLEIPYRCEGTQVPTCHAPHACARTHTSYTSERPGQGVIRKGGILWKEIGRAQAFCLQSYLHHTVRRWHSLRWEQMSSRRKSRRPAETISLISCAVRPDTCCPLTADRRNAGSTGCMPPAATNLPGTSLRAGATPGAGGSAIAGSSPSRGFLAVVTLKPNV